MTSYLLDSSFVADLLNEIADHDDENDAWQAAVAECMKARVLGHDHAFKRLAAGYEDYRP